MEVPCLPAMAPHSTLSAWIERHETLLTSVLVSGDGGLCALFLSCDASGDFLLRRCEGADDGWMTWREQRRLRSSFGRSYADAIATAWISRSERRGDRLEWMARAPERVGNLPVLAAAA